MKYILLISIFLVFSSNSCKKQPKKDKPKELSKVKLFIVPDSKTKRESVLTDLAMIKNRLNYQKRYTNLDINSSKELYISFDVSNYTRDRRFLSNIKTILAYPGAIQIRKIIPYPDKLKKQSLPGAIHRVTIKNRKLIGSIEKMYLLKFLSKIDDKSGVWYLMRIPRGVYDFSQSYWVAYFTGDQVKFSMGDSNIVIDKGIKINNKQLAVILDDYILKTVDLSKGRKISISDPFKRFSKIELKSILKYGILSNSWRIYRIEASQEL